jgi:hypothetical protein
MSYSMAVWSTWSSCIAWCIMAVYGRPGVAVCILVYRLLHIVQQKKRYGKVVMVKLRDSLRDSLDSFVILCQV